jgi:hypothetical protein
MEGRRLPPAFDRYPFSSPFVHRWVGALAWPTWLLICAGWYISFLAAAPGSLAFDVRIYQLAARALLHGEDPWAPSIDSATGPVHFAGPPSTLLPFIPLAEVPTPILSAAVLASLLLTAIWVLRRLRLPLYWLLFPPIIQSVWVGNMNILVVALLLVGPRLGAAAALLKLYALAPMVLLGRRRQLAWAVGLLVVSAPLLPWAEFMAQATRVSSALVDQSWTVRGGLLTSPLAMVGGAIALVLLGRERAAWLVVPVLFPAAQLHYLTLGLPVLARDRALAVAGAMPIPGVLTVAVICRALWDRRDLLGSVHTSLRSTRRRHPIRPGIDDAGDS